MNSGCVGSWEVGHRDQSVHLAPRYSVSNILEGSLVRCPRGATTRSGQQLRPQGPPAVRMVAQELFDRGTRLGHIDEALVDFTPYAPSRYTGYEAGIGIRPRKKQITAASVTNGISYKAAVADAKMNTPTAPDPCKPTSLLMPTGGVVACPIHPSHGKPHYGHFVLCRCAHHPEHPGQATLRAAHPAAG
ncbi:hypothetical protein G7Z17_g983 [Cylindrodendrum hubeiense]|uniref:Uncharacterized protein n=1 Tax=Cylindrodendrum hubeiense TaxID=595255 RepID=A0A9P5HKG8_9HYPO|nr:hypothetical protein G7Z17_g983 [Cylindrodendrum hubeiense]